VRVPRRGSPDRKQTGTSRGRWPHRRPDGAAVELPRAARDPMVRRMIHMDLRH